jgi:hypothetical protein
VNKEILIQTLHECAQEADNQGVTKNNTGLIEAPGFTGITAFLFPAGLCTTQTPATTVNVSLFFAFVGKKPANLRPKI